jgi:hypothetical protein
MAYIFTFLGALSLVGGGFAAMSIRSDIQLGIAVTCFIGGCILIGIGIALDDLGSGPINLA